MASSAAALPALRRHIAGITNAKPDEPPGLATGIAPLDAALGVRGVPRGRLTEVVGARGSGKTTLLRRLVLETVARGRAVAWVDAARTLAPRDWAPASAGATGARHSGASRNPADDGERFWVIRPRHAARGAWCADVLLRSGAFALVVLDGAPPLARAVAARLTRLARDANAAFVVVSDGGAPATLLPAALRLRVARVRAAPAPRMAIVVEKGGARTIVEVEHGIGVAHRLCTHPEVPDRRGVARADGGWGARAGGAVGPAAGGAARRPATPHDLVGRHARGGPRGHDRARGPRMLCGAGDHSMG